MEIRNPFRRKDQIPDTIGELLNQTPVPHNAIGGLTMYELSNHELMCQSCGNLKLDAVSKALFKLAYEFARYGNVQEGHGGELEET